MIEVERNIFSIFPIHIFVERNFLSTEHCDLIMKHLSSLKTHRHSLLEGESSTSYKYIAEDEIFDKVLKSVKPLKEIKQRIQERIDYFTNFSNIQPCRLHHSWYNVQKKGSSLTLHAHNGSIVSGALYINTDEFSSNLDFINPNYAIHLGFGRDRESDFVYKHKVEKGSLILFPSYLAHGNLFSENKTKNRTVISFNTN